MLIFVGLCILLLGYFVYGKFVENVFGPDDRPTPAYAMGDGVDFVPMPIWKTYLIQLLNIAGTGPIFGALAGAVFGPIVLLWIVFGCILGGAVHDYILGMISLRHKGCSVGELTGMYIGTKAMIFLQFYTVLMMIVVGAVFTISSASLLNKITPDYLNLTVWTVVVLIYFFLSTFLPIDKLIGKIYPFFGLVLLIMVVGIFWGIFGGNLYMPAFTLANLHPKGIPAWPFLCISVACGAISGFHATQSPLMGKCIKTEREGRIVFYGAMIMEGIIALAWAGAGLSYYGSSAELSNALATLTASGVVYNISVDVMGEFGAILAILGVAVCPITTGDTALRVSRLILAECLHMEQKSIKSRLLLTIPIIVATYVLMNVNFSILWRYFAWINQNLGMMSLWMATKYMLENNKGWKSVIVAFPAAVMTAVCVTYILMVPEGFALSESIAYSVGALCSVAGLIWWAKGVMSRRAAQ